jgi:hypothetical protein
MLLLFVNAVGPGMLMCNSVYNGDMQAKLMAKIAKAKGSLEKVGKVLFCFKGQIGAAIAAIEYKQSDLTEELNKTRGARPEKYDVKTTLKLWGTKKAEEEEQQRIERLEKQEEAGKEVEMSIIGTSQPEKEADEVTRTDVVKFDDIEQIDPKD